MGRLQIFGQMTSLTSVCTCGWCAIFSLAKRKHVLLGWKTYFRSKETTKKERTAVRSPWESTVCETYSITATILDFLNPPPAPSNRHSIDFSQGKYTKKYNNLSMYITDSYHCSLFACSTPILDGLSAVEIEPGTYGP